MMHELSNILKQVYTLNLRKRKRETGKGEKERERGGGNGREEEGRKGRGEKKRKKKITTLVCRTHQERSILTISRVNKNVEQLDC